MIKAIIDSPTFKGEGEVVEYETTQDAFSPPTYDLSFADGVHVIAPAFHVSLELHEEEPQEPGYRLKPSAELLEGDVVDVYGTSAGTRADQVIGEREKVSDRDGYNLSGGLLLLDQARQEGRLTERDEEGSYYVRLKQLRGEEITDWSELQPGDRVDFFYATERMGVLRLQRDQEVVNASAKMLDTGGSIFHDSDKDWFFSRVAKAEKFEHGMSFSELRKGDIVRIVDTKGGAVTCERAEIIGFWDSTGAVRARRGGGVGAYKPKSVAEGEGRFRFYLVERPEIVPEQHREIRVKRFKGERLWEPAIAIYSDEEDMYVTSKRMPDNTRCITFDELTDWEDL